MEAVPSDVAYNRDLILSLLRANSSADSFIQPVMMTTARISQNANSAKCLLPLYEEIVGRGAAIGEAHLAIADCYKRGHGAPHDPEKALYHIREAISLDHEPAKWFYGHWLLNNDGLSGKLAVDAEAALKIFRELANSGKDPSTVSLAAADAIKLIIAGKTAQSSSSAELADIDRFCMRTDWLRGMSFSLARFYSDGIESKDFNGPEFSKARKFLVDGLNSGREDERQKCMSLLEKWNALPTETKLTTFSDLTLTEKATLASIPIILAFWSIVGLSLLALVTAISAWAALVIACVAAAIWVIRLFKR
ncbi:hypothetical protein ACC756_36985 [Rhizobium ruizarguesonis]